MPLAKPGDLLQDNHNSSYRIDKYLGEGVTAEVYKATRVDDNQVVALKILRPNLPPEIVQSFRDEAPTIGELVQYSYQRYPYEPLHVPRVLVGPQKNDSLEFMVMEYVVGQPLDELIIATQGLATIGRESEALLIARQVLQVLFVLHEDIQRSYSDFQLKNIWWLSEQSLAKVMDWNHVSVRAKNGEVPPGAVDDLVRFGAYFYQLLTGQGAFQTGETEAELAERAGEKWSTVSLGTRTIILKALHPNDQSRYQTAREFLADIETMLTMWRQDEDDLYDEANLALSKVKSRVPQSGSDQHTVKEYAESVFSASRAMNLFILRSKETRRIDRMREELERLTANISPVWGVGKDYYQLGSYSEALKHWEPEAKNLKRLDLWRWVMVAQVNRQKASVLKDAYLPIRPLLEEAIPQLHNQHWEQAKETLEQIVLQGITGPEIDDLGYEVEVQEQVKRARLAEKVVQWSEAEQAYAKAAGAIRQIKNKTYLDLLSLALLSPEQLDEKVLFCRQMGRGDAEELRVIDDFRLRVAENNQPVSYLVEQLNQNPSQLRLLNVVLEEAETLPIEEAIQLLSAAAFFGRAPSLLFNQLAEKRKIQQQELINQYNNQLAHEYAEKTAIQQASYQGWLSEQKALLQQAVQAQQWEKVHTIASKMGGDVPQEVTNNMRSTFNAARQKRDWPLALALGNALSLIYTGNEKLEIEWALDDASRCQKIDLKVLQFNDQLLQAQFLAADVSLMHMKEQIEALNDSSEQQRWHGELTSHKAELDERKNKVIKEVPIDQLITILDRNELRDMSMKIENRLQSIEEQLDTVVLKNEELDKRNTRLLNQLDHSNHSKGRRAGWLMALGIILPVILLLIGGGFFLKTTQIDPMAAQVAGLAELPTTVADFQVTQAVQSATQLASLGDLSLTLEHIVQTQAAITPVPLVTTTPTIIETPLPEATPIPLVGESLSINVVPASAPDFLITGDVVGNQISPFDVKNVSGGDLDTVFDWPRFDLALSNNWRFDLSGESVMLKHEGQDDLLPLQVHVQMVAEGVAETPPEVVMRSWVLSDTSGAEATMISIEGNSLKQAGFVQGDYIVTWLTPDGQTIFTGEPIPYVPAVTATWQTNSPLRFRPEWDQYSPYNITKEELEITDLEVVVNVHGYVCSINQSSDNLFMFLAVSLNSDPEQNIYWLRNNITNEFAREDSNFELLESVFDGVDTCVDSAIAATPPPTPTPSPEAENTATPESNSDAGSEG